MLFETIRCEDGIVHHLQYHEARIQQSLQALGYNRNYPLHQFISPPDSGLYRCKFIYDQHQFTVEYHPYHRKIPTSFQLIYSDIDYSLKKMDRDELNLLFSQRNDKDEIIIIKNGLLTDTSIANLALYLDHQWYTPQTPLLQGTTRARLIENSFLHPSKLTVNDLSKASKIAVMNAMIGFVEIKNGIIS